MRIRNCMKQKNMPESQSFVIHHCYRDHHIFLSSTSNKECKASEHNRLFTFTDSHRRFLVLASPIQIGNTQHMRCSLKCRRKETKHIQYTNTEI